MNAQRKPTWFCSCWTELWENDLIERQKTFRYLIKDISSMSRVNVASTKFLVLGRGGGRFILPWVKAILERKIGKNVLCYNLHGDFFFLVLNWISLKTVLSVSYTHSTDFTFSVFKQWMTAGGFANMPLSHFIPLSAEWESIERMRLTLISPPQLSYERLFRASSDDVNYTFNPFSFQLNQKSPTHGTGFFSSFFKALIALIIWTTERADNGGDLCE